MLDRIRSSLGMLLAQLFFIAAGVYLGNQADQWKEARDHRQAARATLQNFRIEMEANREQLRQHAPIYRSYADSMRVSQARGDAAPRSIRDVFGRLGWKGLNPMRFEHTAWDLALATQSLSYIPRPVAFRVARVYSAQEAMQSMQQSIGTTLFSPASLDDARIFPFLLTFGAYLEDSMIQTRQLAATYDAMIPQLDSAIARLPQ